MTPESGSSLETRPSLLSRLRRGDDDQSWRDFYRIYGNLIRFFALKAGLTADEAEDVVQEAAIGVARGLPNFVYDPEVCRFKTWLLNLTRWRIQNQLRKRRGLPGVAPNFADGADAHEFARSEDSRTGTVERVPDPVMPAFGAEWDSAWEQNLLHEAMTRIRPRLQERQFQAFDLYVTKAWPPSDVARTLGMTVAGVYLAKHRISGLLRKEVRRLERVRRWTIE